MIPGPRSSAGKRHPRRIVLSRLAGATIPSSVVSMDWTGRSQE
ncbi:hypothetical protein RIB2604_00608560 [Aspergillus luchuensis]|uniref:Uncharacterized protein n=1 Tax=Aspergillus kawachii TaxID=1069201 RepID=A0A146F3D8_ASPKA|nr:hypothetical protein RIB2604_00608560 [Aspergillus luchuensis]